MKFSSRLFHRLNNFIVPETLQIFSLGSNVILSRSVNIYCFKHLFSANFIRNLILYDISNCSIWLEFNFFGFLNST